ncbi:hypothetical protein KIK06_25940 [Nocardiopsis sp. EMB25]|uniref:hypothetical protein n=1 Tax=Nocardiopsis sp. EMB25 TaxID=2835867 RepID=UPI002284F23E|nr:hypothetical protein [Nocardiopsis sp. EMB25]MCY9787325.1 hypothetical protein [Nocardiopsis sp. EMB25]
MPQTTTSQAPTTAPIMLPHQGRDLETLLADAPVGELRQMVRELSAELDWALRSFAPAHRLVEADAHELVTLYKAAPFGDAMHGVQVTRAQARDFASAHRQDLVPFADGLTLACWAHGAFPAEASLDHA